MDNIKEFLESTTIHGLTYISTTRKLVRLFWVIVVISGFSGAGENKLVLRVELPHHYPTYGFAGSTGITLSEGEFRQIES